MLLYIGLMIFIVWYCHFNFLLQTIELNKEILNSQYNTNVYHIIKVGHGKQYVHKIASKSLLSSPSGILRFCARNQMRKKRQFRLAPQNLQVNAKVAQNLRI